MLNVLSSIDVAESREKRSAEPAKRRAALVTGTSPNMPQLTKELSTLDWHILSVELVAQRLSTTLSRGLDAAQVNRKLAEYGKNEHTPPSSHLLRRLFSYIFGGFGSLLLISGILCCVAWKPLGEPAPQISNLALGVVLFIVAALQALFNGWQVDPQHCI